MAPEAVFAEKHIKSACRKRPLGNKLTVIANRKGPRISMPHLLELFSGTGSVGRAFASRGWKVTSVDCDPRAEATWTCDVRELSAATCTELHGPVDLIWASPPCTQYSCARTKASTPRDLEGSDAIVAKVLELADELGGAAGPAKFIMENPYTGLLRTRSVVAGIPIRVVDYCTYGAPYRKRTALWTNTSYTPGRPLCRHDCPASTGRRHNERAQRGSFAGAGERGRRSQRLFALYALPPALCGEIADWASEEARKGEERET